ncbi:MAG TPA: hypothetical protein VFN66_05670, partial [Burkholderiales bacterium]|nr:hypothetical protein [Burkholderiales bacterium]
MGLDAREPEISASARRILAALLISLGLHAALIGWLRFQPVTGAALVRQPIQVRLAPASRTARLSSSAATPTPTPTPTPAPAPPSPPRWRWLVPAGVLIAFTALLLFRPGAGGAQAQALTYSGFVGDV